MAAILTINNALCVTTTTLIPSPVIVTNRSFAYDPGRCGTTTYPYTFSPIFSPQNVAVAYFEPDIAFADVQYINIVSIVIPFGLDIKYNGATIAAGDTIYSSGSRTSWTLGQVSITRNAEGVDTIQAVMTFKIKMAGYGLSGNVIANLQFVGCR